MAKKVTVALVDDIDDSKKADETLVFEIDGVTYEIDLTKKHATKPRSHEAKGGTVRVDQTRPPYQWP